MPKSPNSLMPQNTNVHKPQFNDALRRALDYQGVGGIVAQFEGACERRLGLGDFFVELPALELLAIAFARVICGRLLGNAMPAKKMKKEDEEEEEEDDDDDERQIELCCCIAKNYGFQPNKRLIQ
jgi:hypothetical protein